MDSRVEETLLLLLLPSQLDLVCHEFLTFHDDLRGNERVEGEGNLAFGAMAFAEGAAPLVALETVHDAVLGASLAVWTSF